MVDSRELRQNSALRRSSKREKFLEISIVVVILCGAAYIEFRTLSRTSTPPPPEYRVQRALETIELGLMSCTSETGSAPTTVGELRLLDKYIFKNGTNRRDLVSQMVTAGKDYWGNPLQIHPIADQPGRYALRSMGPSGVLELNGEGDDLFVTYPAGIQAASHGE